MARRLGGDETVALTRLDRSQMNLGDERLVERVLGPLEFDWLINAAAYTKVDDCEVQSEHAMRINSWAPGLLARICREKRARMLHVSTDYVFDGRLDRPYTEEDSPNPLSVYGKSKLRGEEAVREADAAHVVMRLSWMFGRDRPGFPDWVVRQAASGRLRVVADKRGCPTYAEDAAEAVHALVNLGSPPQGVLHFCNPPACSWYEYACEVVRLSGADVTPVPIRLADLPGLPAARPDNSALDPGRLERLLGRPCRAWPIALADYFAEKRSAGVGGGVRASG